MLSSYYDESSVQAAVREFRHRELIGGLWEEIGRLQIDFLIANGLQPRHRLLDIGAGSLRLGRHAVAYLDPGRYFATDLSAELMLAGWERELDEVGQSKLPLENLHAGDGFDFGFLPAPVDFGMAQSVFTHLPLNHLRRCLGRAAAHLAPGGRLFVTAFIAPPDAPLDQPLVHNPGGVTSCDIADPYHYRAEDFAFAARDLGWATRVIGAWDHPRDQQMIEYLRL